MLECKICGVEIKNFNSLGKHLFHSHKEITKEEYYNEYINEVSSICECGSSKKFRGLGEGYRTFCSVKCRSNNEEIKTQLSISRTGKKQSEKHIRKRVNNTDQNKKEQTRKNTMLKRYGVDNPTKVEEFLEKSKIRNKPLPPRTEEHSRKIIEAKGISRYKDIVSRSITDEYLYWEGIQATIRLSNSSNAKTVIIGSSNKDTSIILDTKKTNHQFDFNKTK